MRYSEALFPKAAKCSYDSYGPSGTLQSFDALCLLPLNILKQKVFIIIWTWYIIQLFTSILSVFYWIVISSSESVRISILRENSMRSIPLHLIFLASQKAHLGHFFVLNQITKNTDPLTFVELITELGMTTTTTATELDRNENV